MLGFNQDCTLRENNIFYWVKSMPQRLIIKAALQRGGLSLDSTTEIEFSVRKAQRLISKLSQY